jgi:NADH-quinone oxidoreductase subunit C
MDIRTPVPTIYGDWPQKFGPTWKEQVAQLQAKFGQAIEEVRMPVEYPTDVPIVYVARAKIVEVLRFVKEEPGFEYEFLSDITATDESPAELRFEVVYNLFALNRGPRLRLKVRVAEGEPVPTATGVWKAANWAEREVWDMFGVKFEGHPDLRRILMDERWQGHPLRKDYPLRGYQVFTDPMPARPELLE